MKLYRYRLLNELLFKELLYSEIYLASPQELNDPLDLNGQINFFSESEDQIKTLVRFLSRRLIQLHLYRNNFDLAKRSMDLFSYERLGLHIANEFRKRDSDLVAQNDLFEIISCFCRENASEKCIEEQTVKSLFSDIDRSFSQFLNNSSVACFSKNHTNFLMWSHYSSGHAGICLEFEVDIDPEDSNICTLPVMLPAVGKNIEIEDIEWKENIKAVMYPASLSMLNFYDYLTIFNNEGDVDLMNLSKSYWHPYATRIEKVFLEKLKPWCEEEEWRLVRVSFQEEMPEDRVLKFNSNALTGIYLGAKASERTQNRVQNIINRTNCNPVLYRCNVDGTRGVHAEIASDLQ